MTLIQCFGLTDGSLTSKPKMPPGYQPTFVHIYDMERLTGTGGYLMEWEQSGVPRSKWFRQRYLSVRFGEEKQHCWGFGYHGNLLLTNWTPQHDRLREYLGRPVARFDRFYRIDGRFTPQETRFVWSVFERGAVFQKFEYNKEGFLERVTALFVSQQ